MSKIISPPTLRVFQEHLVSFSTLRAIEELFEDAGLSILEGYDPGEQSVRRNLIKQYYAAINLENWFNVRKLLTVFEVTLISLEEHIRDTNTPESQKQLKQLCEYLKRDHFSFKEGKIISSGNPIISTEECIDSENYSSGISDLFKHQFPSGLPFGLTKPDFAIVSDKGSQKLHFELKSKMGILRQDIYPNFNFKKFEVTFETNKYSTDSIKKLLIGMNQTESEKSFFLNYARTFKMAVEDVPVLIPQAWMQWHSLPKRNLRANNSSHADELYRIDFIAFWNNKRFAILIDDVSHYAKKNGVSWIADEECYSKKLKEDRKLRKEKWQVFRVSNWEIRDSALTLEILKDLREFIGF